MQAVEGRQWWMLTFGSSEIRSCAAGLTSERAIHSATPAGLNFGKPQLSSIGSIKLDLLVIHEMNKLERYRK